jgi:hypothetical protein
MIDSIRMRLAIGKAAFGVIGTDCAVEIAGVRIEACDEYGATATTKDRDVAVKYLKKAQLKLDRVRELREVARLSAEFGKTEAARFYGERFVERLDKALGEDE